LTKRGPFAAKGEVALQVSKVPVADTTMHDPELSVTVKSLGLYPKPKPVNVMEGAVGPSKEVAEVTSISVKSVRFVMAGTGGYLCIHEMASEKYCPA